MLFHTFFSAHITIGTLTGYVFLRDDTESDRDFKIWCLVYIVLCLYFNYQGKTIAGS